MKSIFRLAKVILLVVLLALLAGFALFLSQRALTPLVTVNQAAAFNTAKSHLQNFDVALLSHRAKSGAYPTTEQGLKAMTRKPTTEPIPRKWSATMNIVPKDSWGSDYIYEQPGKHNPDSYDLYSPGADRIPHTADDIGNWE